VVKVALVVMGLLGLPMLFLPDLVLLPFLHDPETRAIAGGPLRLVGGFMFLDAIGFVLMNALQGAGATQAVMRVSIALQWGLLLPVAYVLGPVLGFGLFAIWLAQVGHRALLAVAVSALWQRRGWVDIEV
jgi:Na+-driven multidrug efflux pump